MKKTNWLIIIVASILLIALFTNPTTEEHQQAVKNKINGFIQKSISGDKNSGFENLGLLVSNSLIQTLIENSTSRNNYILFSLTKVSWEGESKIIGYGLFGNVFLSNKIDENYLKSFDNSNNFEDVERIVEPPVEPPFE